MFSLRNILSLIGVSCLLTIAACQGDLVEPSALPRVLSTASHLNPLNNLSAVVNFSLANADSARVLYEGGGETGATPWKKSFGDAGSIAVLGLKPNTFYSYRVEVTGRGRVSVGSQMAFATGALPAALAEVKLVTTAGTMSGGYILTTVRTLSDPFAVAFGPDGSVRWYRAFPEYQGLPILEIKQQPNNHITTFIGSSQGFENVNGLFVEYMPSGELVRTWSAPVPLHTDPHEIRLTEDATGTTAHFFAYDVRQLNMQAYGGPVDAHVAGHSVVRQRDTGEFTKVLDS